jgi:hypothetical protein
MDDLVAATNLIAHALTPEDARKLGGLMLEWRRNGEAATAKIKERAAIDAELAALCNRQNQIIRECKRLTCPCLSDGQEEQA